MTKQRRSFTVYSIRDRINGVEVTDFNQVIRDQALTDPSLASHDIEPGHDYDARLFVLAPPQREPDWAEFLRGGFSDLQVPESAANRAVLVVRVSYYSKDRYFAFTFGAGRYLLKPNSYTRNYGLRAALNAIYKGDESGSFVPSDRIRRVDSKIVSANTLHTRRQTNRLASFDVFDVDISGDLLKAVTGLPMEERWGSRITGSDALYVSVKADLSDLGGLCKRIWWIEKREHAYRTRFGWIDNVKFVLDPDLLDRLENIILDKLLSRQTDSLTLAPPELIDWDTLDKFCYSFAQDVKYDDLLIGDFLDGLEQQGKLSGLNLDKLKRTYRAKALDNIGVLANSWSLWQCLDGEITEGGNTYVLDAGDFYEVAPGFMTGLDAYIGSLQECPVVLPASPMEADGKEQTEGEYNESAANSSTEYLLLDKEMVKVNTHTSPIEICDILTTDKQFIHVKRKLQSSSLSHLFAQGSVSADLYLMSEHYRQKVLDRVAQLENALVDSTGDNSFQNKFSDLVSTDPPVTNQFEVVYAIVAKWAGRNLVTALPFFSKVNLRRHAEILRRMGYIATYKKIEVV